MKIEKSEAAEVRSERPGDASSLSRKIVCHSHSSSVITIRRITNPDDGKKNLHAGSDGEISSAVHDESDLWSNLKNVADPPNINNCGDGHLLRIVDSLHGAQVVRKGVDERPSVAGRENRGVRTVVVMPPR